MALPLDSPSTCLCIGDWTVGPATGQLTRGDSVVQLEARTLRLLLCLAGHAGEVVSIDALLKAGWQDVIVSPDSVYQAITGLRRQLGDDPRSPVYIATVPRRGYRLVAPVAAPIEAHRRVCRGPCDHHPGRYQHPDRAQHGGVGA